MTRLIYASYAGGRYRAVTATHNSQNAARQGLVRRLANASPPNQIAASCQDSRSSNPGIGMMQNISPGMAPSNIHLHVRFINTPPHQIQAAAR